VIAALQTLGGTPTVTLDTKLKYAGGGAAAPGATPAPAAPPKGSQLMPALPKIQPVVAHHTLTMGGGGR
jgi:hypothetical protein